MGLMYLQPLTGTSGESELRWGSKIQHREIADISVHTHTSPSATNRAGNSDYFPSLTSVALAPGSPSVHLECRMLVP